MQKVDLKKVLDLVINEEMDSASGLLHQWLVEMTKSIHESLMQEDDDVLESDDLTNGIEDDQKEIDSEEYFGKGVQEDISDFHHPGRCTSVYHLSPKIIEKMVAFLSRIFNPSVFEVNGSVLKIHNEDATISATEYLDRNYSGLEYTWGMDFAKGKKYPTSISYCKI